MFETLTNRNHTAHKIIMWFVAALSDQNGYYKLSMGRFSWIAWFWATVFFMHVSPSTIAMVGLGWWCIGLSCLAYVIGTKYIITKIGGYSHNETVTTNFDFSNNEHPEGGE